jgi:hypothetical protein
MTDEHIDFSQLEPADREALVRAIEARAAALLAERRALGVTLQIAVWWPSVAAAALVVALASTLVLALEPRPIGPNALPGVTPTTRPVRARTELARELGVPPALAVSLARDTPPTALEFLREVGR